MNIKMTIAGQIIKATTEDSHSARDFCHAPPDAVPRGLRRHREDCLSAPQIDHTGRPKGIDPNVGDLTYYAPWGNLAIFYRDFGYSTGLIKLGRIESGLSHLTITSAASITIEAIE